MQFDALVIGGSYAGLSAAIYIARGLRSVCVIDAGKPRNRFSDAAHGFFGQDGANPAEMIRTARAQLALYPQVTFIDGLASSARSERDAFAVTLESGDEVSGAKIVLAVGVADILPGIPGLAERWGKSVLHCPYCHGYEFSGRQLGVLGMRPMSTHQALLISNWGPTTFFLNGQDDPDPATRDRLNTSGVTVEPTPVVALEGEESNLRAALLADGRRVAVEALYIGAGTRLGSPLAEQLGCAVDEGPFGPIIRVDAAMMTTIPGVYAAGDAMRVPHSAMFAAADGVSAGASVSQSLIFGAAHTAAPPLRHEKQAPRRFGNLDTAETAVEQGEAA